MKLKRLFLGKISFLIIFLLLASNSAWSQHLSTMAQTVYSVSTQESTLRYLLKSPFHDVHGLSQQVSGKLFLSKDGKGSVTIRVPVQSFESGNKSRDAHMQEVTEAGSFPWIELKATCDQVPLPASFPSSMGQSCDAKLIFHGLEQNLNVPVVITFESSSRIHVRSNFSVSLDFFHVERPKILLMKVDDEVKIDANLFLINLLEKA